MKQSIFTITENTQLTATVFRMKLKGDVSDITSSGQFVNIKLDGLYLRRPISVCDCEDDVLTLIYKVVGKGTEQMAKMQEELEAREYEASSGGGMVTVKVSGRKELLSIEIKPEAVDPDDVEMLQDLVLAAVNEALRTANDTTEREMSKLTGGLSMPGLF